MSRSLLVPHGEAPLAAGGETFELRLHGGAIGRRCRKLRPDVDALPWGTLASAALPADVARAACEGFAFAAFQEYRGAAVCAETVRALLGAKAPLDLTTTASRFLADETTHTELYARLAAELGAPPAIRFAPDDLVPRTPGVASPRLAALELVVRYCCIGETVSEAVLRAMRDRVRHALVRGALQLILRDEAAHVAFGWTCLRWAQPLDAATREHLGRAAREMIVMMVAGWSAREADPAQDRAAQRALGWISGAEYAAVAERALERRVLPRLRSFGIDPAAPVNRGRRRGRRGRTAARSW